METPLVFFKCHKIIKYIFVNGNAHADVAPPYGDWIDVHWSK